MTRTNSTAKNIVDFKSIDLAILSERNVDLKLAFASVTKTKFREAELSDTQAIKLAKIVTMLFDFALEVKLDDDDRQDAMRSALLRAVLKLRDHAQRIQNITSCAKINDKNYEAKKANVEKKKQAAERDAQALAAYEAQLEAKQAKLEAK